MTVCPACSTTIETDELLTDRQCSACATSLDDLYRLASGLPTRQEKSGLLWREWSR